MVDPIEWPVTPPFTGLYPPSSTCKMQMRTTKQECHGREMNTTSNAQNKRTAHASTLDINVRLNGEQLKEVDCFRYFGSQVAADGGCSGLQREESWKVC